MVLLSLAAGGLGFLLNSWSVPLFTGVSLVFGGMFPGNGAAEAQFIRDPDDIKKLEEKLKAFQTLGGQVNTISNLADLAEAIRREVEVIARLSQDAHPERGRPGPSLEDIQRLNVKLDLYTAMGGHPVNLNLSGQLKKAIEAELMQLKATEPR